PGAVSVLPQHGDGLERARHPRSTDVLRLPPDDRRLDAVASGRNQEGARGVGEQAAAALGAGARAPRIRALSTHAAYQSPGPGELHHVSRGRPRDAAGLSGGHAQDGLVRQLPPPAQRVARLHAVPLLRPDAMDRRRFLRVLGATGGGAAALTGCGIGPEPTEQLVPYLVPPENQVPGIATYYATTCRECAAGCGLHARVREGRVIKLEGNPESPLNQGRLCARGQAALQGLYNPDRITDPMARGANGQWRKLSWYDFANARYIVSFGADFMETWLSPVGYQNSFTRAHAFTGGRDASMAKFVYVGPRLALTGMSADEWIAAAPGTEGVLALAMAH